jgi:hypothetical protein
MPPLDAHAKQRDPAISGVSGAAKVLNYITPCSAHRAPSALLETLVCGVLGWREGEALTRPRTDYDPKEKMSAPV